ncbi:glycosyltransferase family 4 protein [Vibrio fluvialis]|nr:glycosyltransferase family 4 protein [Vibrio fluvialis]
MNEKILLIGPKLRDRSKDIGGTTVLMYEFERELFRRNVDFHLIPSNRFNNVFLNYIYVIYKTLININKYDVVVGNAAINFLYYLSPILLIICKVFRKKYILRKFGGNLDRQYQESNFIKKKLIEVSIHFSDAIFVETKMIRNFLIGVTNVPVFLFYNNRSSVINPDASDFEKRTGFVFVSQIKREKGILEIILANKELDEKIEYYGPILDSSIDLDSGYNGILKPSEVLEKISTYKALILPTYWHGEGYPGIILEAFSVGVPVISTNFRSIPEIIDDNINGLIIEPRSADDLLKAIRKMDNSNSYSEFCRSARDKFEMEYESSLVHEHFLDDLKIIIKG